MNCCLLQKSKVFILSLVAVLLLVSHAWAGFEEEVGRDLAAASGYLVAPVGQMWLIDADAKAGVQVGDLFSIVRKGDPIIHPVTKEVIGNLDEVVGVLRVTKVKSGYSYAAVLSGAGELNPGTEVKRFANLPVTFWDYTGEGEPVYADLQAALPELDWQSYAASQQSRPATPEPQAGMPIGLVFVLTDQGLAVKDTSFQPIRFYRPQQLAAQVAPATPAGQAQPAPQLAAPAPRAAGIVAASRQGGAMAGDSGGSSFFGGLFSSGPQSQPVQSMQGQRGGLIVSRMDSKDGVWYGPRMHGQPIGVDVGDFNGDGKNDVAMCFKDRLVLAQVENGEFKPLADFDLAAYGDALSLDAVDLDHNGRPEFYISVVAMNAVKSLVLELQGDQLVRVIDQIPFFVRKVHMADEGYVLLGQELNPDLKDHLHDLDGPIFRVSRNADRLERAGNVVLPNILTLYGFMPFTSNGHPLIANININDKLQALEMGGATLWESYEEFGGSESSFERPDGSYEMGSRYAFIKPRIEPGPNGTALVPVNEGSRLFGSLRDFRSSHLRAVEFDGYSFVERWRTKPQGGYLADFRMADADNDGVDEIVMLVMFSHGSWFKSQYGNTALLIYEMQ